MRIAIDIDDVLVVTLDWLLRCFNEDHGTHYTADDMQDYHFNWISEFSSEYILDYVIQTLRSNVSNLSPDEPAIATLKKWKERGHSLYILTSRSPQIYEETCQWLERWFGAGFFDDVLFYKQLEGISCKSEACISYDIDLFIEDAPHYASLASQCGVWVFLMDRPWNRHIAESKHLLRVKDWEDIDEKMTAY